MCSSLSQFMDKFIVWDKSEIDSQSTATRFTKHCDFGKTMDRVIYLKSTELLKQADKNFEINLYKLMTKFNF